MTPERRGLLLPLVLLGVLALAVLGLGGFILWELRPLPSPEPAAALPMLAPSATPPASPTPPPAIAPTEPAPAPVATVQPTQAPSLAEVALNNDQLAQVDRVRQDIIDLRKIKPQAGLTLHLVSSADLAALARGLYLDETAAARLARESRALQTLGLLPPGYDLSTAEINRRLHPAGGLVHPANGELYIAGARFGALQRRLLSDLVDRSLLEEKLGLSAVLEAPECETRP